MKRVVVTGFGVVSSIGIGRETFWKNLLDGKSGISTVESFDISRYKTTIGGEIKGFKAEDHLPDHNLASYGRASRFALTAAVLALADADLRQVDPTRAGVTAGTTSGEPNQVERLNDRLVAETLDDEVGAVFANRYPCHNIAVCVAAELGLEATTPMMIPAACAAGNYAIANAVDSLRMDRADIMLAGGSDAFSRITYTGFARLNAIAPETCSPFDLNRKGMIPGEGAGFLVLESLDHAHRRGARIYAEVAGYGLTCDANHMTAMHPEGLGAAAAMQKALSESGLNPEDVNYISAHGTGTRSNDHNETNAVKRVFKQHAPLVPISSIKSMIGHTMGAASAIEAGVCALTIAHNQIPPTMNYQTPDPDCDLDYVPNEARCHRVNVAMNNAYAFGGANASLILKVMEG